MKVVIRNGEIGRDMDCVVMSDDKDVGEFDTVMCRARPEIAIALQSLWQASRPVADQSPRNSRETTAGRAAFYSACARVKEIVAG